MGLPQSRCLVEDKSIHFVLLAWDLDAITMLPLIPPTSVFLKSVSQPENVAPTPLGFQMGVTAWFLIAEEVDSQMQERASTNSTHSSMST